MTDAIFENPTAEERPFLEAICANPADLDSRLVFADWLDERGDPRGEWLRASIEIERGIESLGWGFAFRPWRPFAKRLLANEERLQAAFEICRSAERPHWLAYPAILRLATSGRWYCGGFVENIAIGRAGLKEHGEPLRRCIPLRGVEALSGLPGSIDFGSADLESWQGIERIVDMARRPNEGFAPFVSLARSRAFAEATHDVRALATGPLFQPEALAAFLNAKPIESLYLAVHSKLADRQLERLFALWQPDDLRCLGLLGLSVQTRMPSTLAEWPGLRSVRLFDLANASLGERARRALIDSPFAHPNLCVAYAFSSEQKRAPQEEGIVWLDSRLPQQPQASLFELYVE